MLSAVLMKTGQQPAAQHAMSGCQGSHTNAVAGCTSAAVVQVPTANTMLSVMGASCMSQLAVEHLTAHRYTNCLNLVSNRS
jgi:hypothetical protein